MLYPNRQVGRLSGLLLALMPILCLGTSPTRLGGAEVSRHSFALVAADAEVTLEKFSEQSGAQIVYLIEDVRGVTTNPVQGQFAIREALHRLLAGTALRVKQDGKTGAYAIRRDRKAQPLASAPAPPNPIRNPPMKKKKSLLARLTAVLAALSSAVLSAQTAPAETPSASASAEAAKKDEMLKLDAFVVVGSAINKTEMESANSIATITQSQMQRLSPRSTADLLTQIPGLYVEPTGGQISNNYYIRGLPSGGGTKFLGLVEDGLPIVINNSDFTFRGDALTTDRVEVLRGGASSILTSFAAGGTINFITHEGSAVAEGAARLMVSDYGQLRADAFYSGPLGKGITYSVGGYYNRSESQRETGFGKSERGGQVIGNLKFEFPDNRGYLKVMARHLDDQSPFFATELFQNQKHPESVPGGPGIRHGTFFGPDLARLTIWTGDGPIVNDFSEGVPVRMTYGGTELKYRIAEGWTIINRNRATRFHHKFNGLFGGNTVDGTGNALATYGIPILIRNASTKPGFGNLANFASYRVTNATTGEVIDPVTMNGNGAIQLIFPMDEFGLEKNYQNDFQLQKETGASVTTAGLYYSDYRRNFTQFGNQALTDVRNHARLLDVEAFDAAGNSLGLISDHGFTQYGAWYTRNKFEQDNVAFYLTEELKLGRLRIDAGWRHEEVDMEFNQGPQSGNSTFIPRAINQHNPALFGGNTVAAGPWTKTKTSNDSNSVSAGLNFLLNDSSALYGRYSKSTFLSQDPQSTTPTPQPKITQIELGYRGAFRALTWNVTLYDSEATNNSVNVGIPVNGTLIFDNKFLKTRDYGIEVLATLRATAALSLDLQGTLSQSEYRGRGVVQSSSGENIPVDGNRPVRQPEQVFSVTGRYGFKMFNQTGNELFVTDAYTGKRASDIANTVWLPSFNIINAGLILRPTNRVSVKFQVSNLFNETGLTEGNPRQTQVVGNTNAVFFGARAIFGRSFQSAVEYHF